MICSSPSTIIVPGETEFLFGSSKFDVKKKHIKRPSREFWQLRPLLSPAPKTMEMVPSPRSIGVTSLIQASGAGCRVNALCSMRVLRNLLVVANAFVLLLVKRAAAQKAGKEKSGRKRAVASVRVAMLPGRSGVGAVDQEVAVRRALAVWRVAQEEEDDDTARDFSLFVTPRGNTLFTHSWTPASVGVRGVVLILHGLNEHSGRYGDFAKQLNANGFKVYGMDWIGHGGSDGLHAYVQSLDDAVSDVKLFVDKIVAENPGLPCFCFGHSTGAAIILKAMLDPVVESRVAGIAVTPPAVGVQPSHPIFAVLAPVIALLLPKFQLTTANKRRTPGSRDPKALVAKYSDPLVYTGSMRVRTGYEILQIASYLQQNMSRLTVPFFVLHGTADTVTDPKASQRLYDNAASIDKTIKLFEGFLHDLLFEPEREDIVSGIIEWYKNRL